MHSREVRMLPGRTRYSWPRSNDSAIIKESQNLESIPEEIFTTSAAFVSSIIQVSRSFATRMLHQNYERQTLPITGAKIRKKAFVIGKKSEAHDFGIYSFLCITAAFEKEVDQSRA